MNKIIYDMSFTDYLAAEGVSQSQLKNLAKCPAYYKYMLGNTLETDAMRFGRMFHAYVLEPHVFSKDYYVTDKIRKAGKVWESKQKLASSKQIIWRDEFSSLRQMKKSIRQHKWASKFFNDTKNEVSLFWELDINNNIIAGRGRIDAIKHGADKVALIDIKTTKDAERSVFEKDIFNLKYHMQAAYYMDGFKAVTGEIPDYFLFIAVEKKPPYLVSVNPLAFKSEAIELGRQEYLEQLNKHINCTNNNKWNAGYDSMFDVTVPAWYINKRKYK